MVGINSNYYTIFIENTIATNQLHRNDFLSFFFRSILFKSRKSSRQFNTSYLINFVCVTRNVWLGAMR